MSHLSQASHVEATFPRGSNVVKQSPSHCERSAPLFFRTMTGVELGDLLFNMDQKQLVTPGSNVHAVERYPEKLRVL